ncbi:MAG: hypothetical protein ACRDLP_06275 [Solirubrobacteraceae bacterium]
MAAAPALAGPAPFTSPRIGAITVRIGRPVRECDKNGTNCDPQRYRPVTITFVARANLEAGVSWYELNLTFTSTGPCSVEQGGTGGPSTPYHLRAGQRARWVDDIVDCPRIVHGAIVYDTSTAPHTGRYVPNVGYIDGALVGTFSFHMS